MTSQKPKTVQGKQNPKMNKEITEKITAKNRKIKGAENHKIKKQGKK